jgi:hypothetical protein
MSRWRVVGPLPPLDQYEDCSIPLDVFIAKRKRDGVSVTDLADAILAYRDTAGVNVGEWRHEPRVWFDPFSDGYALLVKEDNNGTTYLVVRDAAPYARMMSS